MILAGCLANPTVATIPSDLELATSNDINQLIKKIELNNVVDEVNNGNIVYAKYFNNASMDMKSSLNTLCEERYKATVNNTEQLNLHEYGGSQLQIEQATEAAKQWIVRKYPDSDIQSNDAVSGQCVRYQGEPQTLDILYAYQIIKSSETNQDEVSPVHLIIMKSEYFDSMIEEALANEPETFEQRNVRLAKEAAIAKELEQIEMAKQARIKRMAPFIDARGKQVCNKFTTTDKLLKYEIKREASMVGFLEDNTDTRIQIRITGISVDNKKPQDLLVSDDIDYKGSKAVTGNIIWDSPSGWYFCNK
jgi:hypothetical protein